MYLYLGKTVLDIISQIDSPVSTWLMAHYRRTADYPVNFLEMKGNNIEFLPAARCVNKSGFPAVAGFTEKGRQIGRIGRIITKLAGDVLSESDIRAFTESVSAINNHMYYTFKIVEGKELADVYQIPKSDLFLPHGTMFNSCFQGRLKDDQLEIFVKNPDKIKMLTVWRGDKLAGRCTLWCGINKETKEPLVMHDRQYTSSPTIEKLMTSYLAENNIPHCYNSDKNLATSLVVQVKRGGCPPYFDYVKFESYDSKCTKIVSKAGSL